MGDIKANESAVGATRAPSAVRRGRRSAEADEPVRDRIFRIATELFARNGFNATGVQELSEAVGLGRGALYYHIKSKEELLFSISATLLDEMLERALEIVALDEPVEVRIHRLAEVLLRDLAERRDAWTVSLSELRALPLARRRGIIARRDRFEQIWACLLKEGADEGVLRPVDEVALRGILGLLNSTYLWITASGSLAPERIADIYTDLLLDGLRPR